MEQMNDMGNEKVRDPGWDYERMKEASQLMGKVSVIMGWESSTDCFFAYDVHGMWVRAC